MSSFCFKIVAGICLIVLFNFEVYGECGLVKDVPKEDPLIGPLDSAGHISFNLSFGALTLADDLKIPLGANFSSDRETKSEFLGFGWKFSLVDSKAVRESDTEMKVNMPDGYLYGFGLVGDGIFKGNKGYLGHFEDSVFIVTAECGSEYHFRDGVLVKIVFTKGRELLLTRGKGGVDGTYFPEPESKGDVVFAYKRSVDGDSVEYNGLSVPLSLGVDGFLENFGALKCSWSNSKNTRFLDLEISGYKRKFSWDLESKLVKSVDDWVYSFGWKKGGVFRENSKGQKQARLRKDGEMIELFASGELQHTKYFTAPTILIGKIREVSFQEMEGGENKLLAKYFYDGSSGQLLRSRRIERVEWNGKTSDKDIGELILYFYKGNRIERTENNWGRTVYYRWRDNGSLFKEFRIQMDDVNYEKVGSE